MGNRQWASGSLSPWERVGVRVFVVWVRARGCTLHSPHLVRPSGERFLSPGERKRGAMGNGIRAFADSDSASARVHLVSVGWGRKCEQGLGLAVGIDAEVVGEHKPGAA